MRSEEIHNLTLALMFLESFSLFHDHGGLKVEGNQFYVLLNTEEREKLRERVNAAIKEAMKPLISNQQANIRKAAAE